MTGGELPAPMAAELVLGLGSGVVLAVAHLAALTTNVQLYLAPGAAWRPVALHFVRLAALVAAFSVAAMLGASVLVATLVGFSVGRVVRVGQLR